MVTSPVSNPLLPLRVAVSFIYVSTMILVSESYSMLVPAPKFCFGSYSTPKSNIGSCSEVLFWFLFYSKVTCWFMFIPKSYVAPVPSFLNIPVPFRSRILVPIALLGGVENFQVEIQFCLATTKFKSHITLVPCHKT